MAKRPLHLAPGSGPIRLTGMGGRSVMGQQGHQRRVASHDPRSIFTDDEVGGGRCADLPADDPAGKGIDHEGDVGEPSPGADVGEIDHPQRVGPLNRELPVDLVQRARCLRVAGRGDTGLSAPYASQSHRPHQPFHGALGDLDSFPAHLVPDLARAVEAEALLVDPLDMFLELVVTASTGRTPAGIGKAGSVFMPGGRGDLQFAADRLDPQILKRLKAGELPIVAASKDDPPRVSERVVCSKPTRLFQVCSSVRRMRPPLPVAADARWRCVAARCYTS